MKQQLPYKGFISALFIAGLTYFGLKAIPHLEISLFPYELVSQKAPHDLFYSMIWYIQDFTNAQFYASFLSGLGLILGGWTAHHFRKLKISGFTIAYIHNIFPWVLGAQLLGLLVSSIYIPLLETWNMGWVPTFIPFVSVPVIVIFVYGPNLHNLLTGSIFAGLISTPMGAFIIKYILDPLGLPAVSANVLTMALVGIIVLETCRYLPWIQKLETEFYIDPAAYDKKYETSTPIENTDSVSWFLRRVLSDFTEAQFYGNEWASGLMLVGLILHFILDRQGVFYGNDFIPLLLSASIVGSAIGVFLYHREWKIGFYATFTPIVTIIPGILLLVNGNIFLTYLSAVIGGIIAPPLAQAINSHIPKGWHPMIGNTLSMSICTALIAMVILALPI